jgi:hypothetical protein
MSVNEDEKGLPPTSGGTESAVKEAMLMLSELIAILKGFEEVHGDVPCVYEGFGVPSPEVIVVRGRLTCDLAAR